jgi:hypothetical protein
VNPHWTLRGLRWSYCAFIALASLVAAQSALAGHGEGAHGGHAIFALAVTEASAAVALLIEPLELIACATLLLVFSVAAVVSIASSEWLAVLRFIFYGATATHIVLASRTTKGAGRLTT